MDYDAVEFLIVGRALRLGIAAHRVEADEAVARDGVVLAIVEGDDVGVLVVVEVLAVHFEYFLIVAEDISHLSHPFAVARCHAAHPRRHVAAANGRHLHVEGVV